MPTHLRVINSIKDKEEAYKRRGKSKTDFYTQARMNILLLERYRAALLESVMLDGEGDILVDWDEQLIEELGENIVDPGPVNKKKSG